MATSPNGTPMRKNARANRERILAAAEAVFGASGELGSTEDVAGRAGVGIATVFRHFPTKDALIEATLVRQFDRLDEQATRLAGEPNPGRAVRELIVTLIETSSTKLTLISLVGENGQLPPAVQEATRRVQAAIGGVLAQRAGRGRSRRGCHGRGILRPRPGGRSGRRDHARGAGDAGPRDRDHLPRACSGPVSGAVTATVGLQPAFPRERLVHAFTRPPRSARTAAVL